MTGTIKDIQRFLFGQHFADGLRMAVLILLPALLCSYLGYFDIGMTISIGALGVSISDIPGPAHHKRNAMLSACGLTFIISLLTGFLRMNAFVMGASLTFFAFFFAMFTMYGARAGFLGTSILLLMVLQMDKDLDPLHILYNSLYLTAGAVWYTAVSLLILSLFPYTAAQRALGECIRETAAYMGLRALLYDNSVPLDKAFTRLIAQQVIINDKQNEVRELLFKNKKIMRQSSRKARAMILTFDEVIDLYEKISASHIDYAAIRERYEEMGLLKKVSTAISEMALALDTAGAGIQYNIRIENDTDIDTPIARLSDEINSIVREEDEPVLDSLLTNIQNMHRVVRDMQHYFTENYPLLNSDNRTLEHSRFVSHQILDPKLFRFNLSFDSLTFRHSLRMALACLVGFILAKSVMHGRHTYWLLITIIFVLKPAFSLTRERNIQRIAGTLIGGVIGVAILSFIHSTTLLFICMFVCMLLTYSFQRHKYLIAVVFMTPYILILFHFMHVGLVEVAKERVIDTVLGSVIALIAGYLILPDWESDQIMKNMANMLRANQRYLLWLKNSLNGVTIPLTDYKLIRKDVYVSTSNLSAALQRMLSEPKRTQKNSKEIRKFSVLNHMLSSHIASAREMIKDGNAEDIAWTEKSLTILEETIQQITSNAKPAAPTELPKTSDGVFKDPYESIYSLCVEIRQISQAILC